MAIELFVLILSFMCDNPFLCAWKSGTAVMGESCDLYSESEVLKVPHGSSPSEKSVMLA